MQSLIGKNLTVTTAAGNTYCGRLVDYAHMHIYISRPWRLSGWWIALDSIKSIKKT